MNVSTSVMITYLEFLSILTRVLPYSPAFFAGLHNADDFILGTPSFYYNNIEEFTSLIQALYENTKKTTIECEIHFFIYNIRRNDVRRVEIKLHPTQSSKFQLGVQLGLGAFNNLHNLTLDSSSNFLI